MTQKLETIVEIGSQIWSDPALGEEFWRGELTLNGFAIVTRPATRSRDEMKDMLTKALLQRFPDADPQKVVN
ncbi:hypothetical protein [uncultured Shimia sp.]|uniref:hypothetical protein n=1 Tax=uncultured Shimia sp. TaxID=573152 RepID=UPI00260C4B60|nr:hypothetical protein [uncultured Shimia sp.]